MICPKCSNQMKIRKGIHGEFWGCSDYPNCKGTVSIKKEGKEYGTKKVVTYNDGRPMDKIIDEHVKKLMEAKKIIVAELSNFDTEKEAYEYMKKIKGIRKGEFKLNHYEKPDDLLRNKISESEANGKPASAKKHINPKQVEFWQVEWKIKE